MDRLQWQCWRRANYNICEMVLLYLNYVIYRIIVCCGIYMRIVIEHAKVAKGLLQELLSFIILWIWSKSCFRQLNTLGNSLMNSWSENAFVRQATMISCCLIEAIWNFFKHSKKIWFSIQNTICYCYKFEFGQMINKILYWSKSQWTHFDYFHHQEP